jgi:hypothetical protein
MQLQDVGTVILMIFFADLLGLLFLLSIWRFSVEDDRKAKKKPRR